MRGKNHANYPSMQIIRAYFTLCFNQQFRVVSWTAMRIIQEVRISEGQIIRTILYNKLRHIACCISVTFSTLLNYLIKTPHTSPLSGLVWLLYHLGAIVFEG